MKQYFFRVKITNCYNIKKVYAGVYTIKGTKFECAEFLSLVRKGITNRYSENVRSILVERLNPL